MEGSDQTSTAPQTPDPAPEQAPGAEQPPVQPPAQPAGDVVQGDKVVTGEGTGNVQEQSSEGQGQE